MSEKKRNPFKLSAFRVLDLVLIVPFLRAPSAQARPSA